MAIGAAIITGLGILNAVLSLRNNLKNRNRDPNALIPDEAIRQQLFTPQQRQAQRQQLTEAEQVLSQPQKMYVYKGIPYRIPKNMQGRKPTLKDIRQQKPLGGLARRLFDLEQSNFGEGLQGDYADIGTMLSQVDPVGGLSSGAQALRGQAFQNRFNQTLTGQMGLISDFARENYLSRIEGSRLNRLRSQIEGQLVNQSSELGREREGLAQTGYLGQRVLGRAQAGVSNEAENQRRAAANRQYQQGISDVFGTRQAPPLLSQK